MVALYFGTFDAERFWRPPAASRLPAVRDAEADAAVAAMDAVQWVFCRSQHDVLLTRQPIADAFRDYLGRLGVRFRNNPERIAGAGAGIDPGDDSLCSLLLDRSDASWADLLAGVTELSPFAVLPATEAFRRRFRLPGALPSIEVVRRVNSKVFSHRLGGEILGRTTGSVVGSAAELGARGRELLARSPILVKDPFGVSGKGQLAIDRPRLLDRIVRYLARQEASGRETQMVVEPLHERRADFSAQVAIGRDGDGGVRLLALRQMDNRGFAFAGCRAPDRALERELEERDYEGVVRRVGEALAAEGYFGPACIDSMLCAGDAWQPVVEINARKSMGLASAHLDRFLEGFSRRGEWSTLAVGSPRPVPFSDLLEELERRGDLFLADRPHGVLPLAPWTLDSPRRAGGTRGRLIVALVEGGGRDRASLRDALDESLAALGCRIF